MSQPSPSAPEEQASSALQPDSSVEINLSAEIEGDQDTPGCALELLPARLLNNPEYNKRAAFLRQRFYPDLPGLPMLLPREFHGISRSLIDPDALKVVYRLLNAGYKAFIVGGGVRDLLIGRQPKDFDIATDASTNDVHRLFRNSRIIGRRFRLNHVYFNGGKIFEVSTFRDNAEDSDDVESTSIITRDNVYGNIESDAYRRDLTINGLFYDLRSFAVIDYVGGVKDLEEATVKTIGDPAVRFREDPVRMIRAVRHAARTGFQIEETTLNAIHALAELIAECSQVRVYEEFLKELKGGYSRHSFELMEDTSILPHIFSPVKYVNQSRVSMIKERWSGTLRKIDKAAALGSDVPVSVMLLSMMLGEVDENFFSTLPPADIEIQRSLWGKSPISAMRTAGKRRRRKPSGDIDSPNLSEGESPAEKFVPDEPYLNKNDRDSECLPLPGSGESPVEPQVESMSLDEDCENSDLPESAVNPTRHLINKLFLPMGVYRADREKMELLLSGRMALIEAANGHRSAQEVYRKSYFEISLQLLDLCTPTEESKHAVSFWLEFLEDAPLPKRNNNSAAAGRRRPRRQRKGPRPENRK
ncbi:MAG: polynucleotide adenylyltransferase PcnB [bacterium]|nr:polynucleotide adenylyltransferase PcnB [bacterium]